MKSLAQKQFRRVLLIKPSSLGDVLHAVPVLWAVRRRYPRARISWLVGSAFAPLLEGHPALDEVILFDRAEYGRVGRSPAVTADFVRFVMELRRRRFDLVIDLQGLIRSGFLAWASGAGVRIGFGQARELAWAFYTQRIPPIRGEAHAVDRNMRVGELLGCGEAGVDLSIRVRPEAKASLAAKLEEAGVQPGEGYLVVAPGARWETKRWPPEHFAAVIDAVAEQVGGRSVLLGSPAERGLGERVAELARSGAVNLAGRTSLPELVTAVDGARALLSNDSGTKDVAVALGRPVVSIFGPTNPLRTSPYRREGDLFRAELECSPCYLRKLSGCPYDHRCMRGMSPEPVSERIVSLWRGQDRYNVRLARGAGLRGTGPRERPAGRGPVGEESGTTRGSNELPWRNTSGAGYDM